MKSFIKAIVFTALLVAFLTIYSYFMIPNKHNLMKYGMFKTSAYEIMEEEENTIDVVFVGDSLIYSSISPMVIWHEYGFTSFDCAQPAQIIEDSYKYLDAAFKSQNPKIVVMEADVIYRGYNKQLLSIKNLNKLQNYLPLERYHNNWKLLLSNINMSNKFLNVNKGYKYITKKAGMMKDNGNMDYTEEYKEIPKGNLEYLDKIIDLCKENGAKFVLISNPSKLSWNFSKRLTMSVIAQDRGIEFLDLNFNNPTDIDWTTETKDKGKHLNYKGAKKVSKYIGNYLKEFGILEDHRNDEKYDEWHEAYKRYLEEHSKYETKATE